MEAVLKNPSSGRPLASKLLCVNGFVFLEQPQSFAIHLHLTEDGDFLRIWVKCILDHGKRKLLMNTLSIYKEVVNMKKVYTKEELVRKNIYIQSEIPDSIEVDEQLIVVKRGHQSLEIPVNSMRGKALLDRLSYKGELTQEIYL
jgi:hypothetical protein